MRRLQLQIALVAAAGVAVISCTDIIRLRVGVPRVVAVDPAPGDTNVDLSAAVRVSFNLPVDSSSVLLGTSFRVTAEGRLLEGTLEVTGDVVTFRADPSLEHRAVHHIEVSGVRHETSGLAMSSALLASFTTRDLMWSSSATVSAPTGDVSATSVAMLAGGRAILAWQQFDGTRSNIWSVRRSGLVWTSPELVEDDNAADAITPALAADGVGGAILTWSQSQGAVDSVWANRFDPQNGWGARTSLEANAGTTSTPRVAADRLGNAVSTWSQWDGSRFNVWANRFVVGTGWLGAESIESNDAGNALLPSVAMASHGLAAVTWYQSNGTRYDIWASELDGAWSGAHLLENDDTGAAGGSVIDLRTDTGFAIWCQSNGTRLGIRANRFVDGAWGTAQPVETDDLGDACRVTIGVEPGGATFPAYDRSAKIAVLANGDAIAVWSESDGTTWNIRSNRWTSGVGWGSPELLEADDGGDAVSPELAVDRRGFVTVVWQQSDGLRTDVRAVRHVPGLGWSTPVTLDLSDNNATTPRVAIDWTTGRGAVIWIESGAQKSAVVSELR